MFWNSHSIEHLTGKDIGKQFLPEWKKQQQM